MAQFREIPEHQAVGEIAPIYDEIHKLYPAPYVSSLSRHLACHPGLLT